MNKSLRILINVLIFAVIAGFVWYMIHSMNQAEPASELGQLSEKGNFVSPYKKSRTFEVSGGIFSFEIYNNKIYAASSDSILIFDLSGNRTKSFSIEGDVRDIAIQNNKIYLLFPAKIEIYSLDGQKNGGWEACSENSDYCAFTFSREYVFVTDAENKHICQYTTEGGFVRFINSPDGFIIPSYSFDIININDTIYCSNSGKHKIESYTLDGNFITSFGETGADAGAFAGCCNPVYLAVNPRGDILTSEKGIPRISCYNKEGKFRTILLDSETLGGGNAAYELKVLNDRLYIAGGKTISEFVFDSNLADKSCAGCEVDCPLRKGVKL